MSGVRKTNAGNPDDWLAFAADDLAAARLLMASQVAYWVARGKLAEAFEKALKADLIRRGWTLEKTHDLQRLCDQLAGYDDAGANGLQHWVDLLAESYTESRYPGFDLDEPDWADFARTCEAVATYIAHLLKHTN